MGIRARAGLIDKVNYQYVYRMDLLLEIRSHENYEEYLANHCLENSDSKHGGGGGN